MQKKLRLNITDSYPFVAQKMTSDEIFFDSTLFAVWGSIVDFKTSTKIAHNNPETIHGAQQLAERKVHFQPAISAQLSNPKNYRHCFVFFFSL